MKYKSNREYTHELNIPVTDKHLADASEYNVNPKIWQEDLRNTLSSFQSERIKQMEVIHNIKQAVNELNYLNERPKTVTEEKLIEELRMVKEQLQRTEQALKQEVLINKKLQEEIASIRRQVKEELMKDIKKRLIEPFSGFNDDLVNLGFEGTINEIKKCMGQLVRDKEKMEEKYQRLFDLHNKQIEVNSSKNLSLNTKIKAERGNLYYSLFT